MPIRSAQVIDFRAKKNGGPSLLLHDSPPLFYY
jgi:hypothetical protein